MVWRAIRQTRRATRQPAIRAHGPRPPGIGPFDDSSSVATMGGSKMNHNRESLRMGRRACSILLSFKEIRTCLFPGQK